MQRDLAAVGAISATLVVSRALLTRHRASAGLWRLWVNGRHTAWFLVWLGACASEAGSPDQPAVSQQSIVYGADDRVDLHEVDDPALRELVRGSMVALINDDELYRPRAGEVRVAGPTLGDAYGLCEGERFARQQVAADCTGVLIDDNLVVTAAHCFEDDDDCDRYAYVFDYYYSAPGQLEMISTSDVYRCRRMVARQLSSDSASVQVDYAVVELDRVPVDRRPAPIRAEPLAVGTPLVTIGTTSGLPMKIDQGGEVLALRAGVLDYFALDSDTFEGSSGSGIFDLEGRLAGILVRGGVDYEEDLQLECLRARVLADANEDVTEDRPVPGEQATYVARVVQGTCKTGYPSAALCGTEASCGDGLCGAGESRFSCPEDCEPCLSGACGSKHLGGAVTGSGGSGNATGDSSGGAQQKARESGCQLTAEASKAGPLWWLAFTLMLVVRRRSVSKQRL